MTAYYNENDPKAAAWLRELIKGGHIAPGDVDDRSIAAVQPSDLAGYVQCHFFAGIGGWSLAARLAGWPDDAPLWTGSCPCQPFSGAGRGRGADDTRHLWPDLYRLLAECRPPVVAGEQVASGLGRAWLAAVRADVEGLGYAVGAADLCAAGVGAPHIRQRLYWVADTDDAGPQGWAGAARPAERAVGPCRVVGGVDESESERGRRGEAVADGGCELGGSGPWGPFDWLPCRDGKARPTQPGLCPLADGVSARVGRLRGYGNAIVPEVAATFLRAYRDVRGLPCSAS